MGLLGRAAILAAEDRPFRDVEVPEWGGTVRIRSISGSDRDQFEAALLAARKHGADTAPNVRASFAAYCIVDEGGNRIFSEGDIDALGDKSAAALERVFAAIQELNALSEADVAELEKN